MPSQHVVGKGAIKALKKAYPQANIIAVDYDPGASEVNQLNRVKLMLSAAHKTVEQTIGDQQNIWQDSPLFCYSVFTCGLASV